MNQLLWIHLTPPREEAESSNPSQAMMPREQELTLCSPCFIPRGIAWVVSAQFLREQRWCFSPRNSSKHIWNLTWKLSACLIFIFQAGTPTNRGFCTEIIFMGEKNVISISCIHLAFCFISVLAYLLLTHFCGFLRNRYRPALFWVRTGLRL